MEQREHVEQPEHDVGLRRSWEDNAAAWTRAVRAGGIASRRAGTDAAVLAACRRVLDAAGRHGATPARALDVGCGEGWLARALAAHGATVLGVDASAALVAEAAGAGGAAAFEVVSYDELVADAARAPGPWELIVCNFSLLGDPLAPLLAALGRRLAPDGRLVVQTVHPWVALGDGAYADGWRVETFAGFAEPFPAAMPWFARTLASWVAELHAGGLALVEVAEPAHPESGRPLSLLLTCRRAP
ncbi:MAG TPA: methyltransferase domain-containing protein [Gemmatimonadaceae bacterium]